MCVTQPCYAPSRHQHLSLSVLLASRMPRNHQPFVKITTNKLTSTPEQSRMADSDSVRGRSASALFLPGTQHYKYTPTVYPLHLLQLPQVCREADRTAQHGNPEGLVSTPRPTRGQRALAQPHIQQHQRRSGLVSADRLAHVKWEPSCLAARWT